MNRSKKKANLDRLRTCVLPSGRFCYSIHTPRFQTANQRESDHFTTLGLSSQGRPQMNHVNMPPGDVNETGADVIYEICNPLPFRGVTFICRSWADGHAVLPDEIRLPEPQPVSLWATLEKSLGPNTGQSPSEILKELPLPVQLALATTSTDPRDLTILAAVSCNFIFDTASGRPTGLQYRTDPKDRPQAVIHNPFLFDAVANNPHLPDDYKEVMVLRPGVQGGSEIVGEWLQGNSHIYEYLRRNSYIPWGHYAANMAQDAVRYAVGDLSAADIQGLRHLYYQRTYLRLAEMLGLQTGPRRTCLSPSMLENMRIRIQDHLRSGKPDHPLDFSATLWGWNYGFDFTPSGYRLHASHQQIHQQFALIPDQLPCNSGADGQAVQAFACGDLVQEFISDYRRLTAKGFFDCYLAAIRSNRRLDEDRQKPADLVVYEDKHVLLFVPKAQTSQWELQLMPIDAAGNILETDAALRQALDRALLIAMRILTGLGATMITVIEYSKRFNVPDHDQRLLYAFLPRLPYSPGAFSEAQLRWINGHYPEDFARACRLKLGQALEVF